MALDNTDQVLIPCTACQASGAVMVETNARNFSARWTEPSYMLVKTQTTCVGCKGAGYKSVPTQIARALGF